MKIIIAVILWFVLLSLCWPIAIAFIFLLPLIWLLLLPFQIIGFTLAVVFKVIAAILLFPFLIFK